MGGRSQGLFQPMQPEAQLMRRRPVGVWRERRKDRRSADDWNRIAAAMEKRARRAERDHRTWTGGRL